MRGYAKKANLCLQEDTSLCIRSSSQQPLESHVQLVSPASNICLFVMLQKRTDQASLEWVKRVLFAKHAKQGGSDVENRRKQFLADCKATKAFCSFSLVGTEEELASDTRFNPGSVISFAGKETRLLRGIILADSRDDDFDQIQGELPMLIAPNQSVWNAFANAHVEKYGFAPVQSEWQILTGRGSRQWNNLDYTSHLDSGYRASKIQNSVYILRIERLVQLKSLVKRIPDRTVYRGQASSAPTINVSSVKALLDIAEKSEVGRNSETVIDTTVRKTMQVLPERVGLQWAALDECLVEISRNLMQGRSLRAEPHKILIYRPGDFFLNHVDSKKHENHLATLTVDLGMDPSCQGGLTVFRDESIGAIFQNDDQEWSETSWQSCGPGSFACWFTSMPHSVQRVESGYRVVATYNIMCDSIEGMGVSIRAPVESLSAISPLFALIGSDIFKKILLLLDLQSCGRLMSTCKSLAQEWCTPEFLVLVQIRGMLPALRQELVGKEVHQLGFLQKHQYSFDGTESVRFDHLYGSDAILFIVWRELLGQHAIETTSCVLRYEVPEDLSEIEDCDFSDTLLEDLRHAHYGGVFQKAIPRFGEFYEECNIPAEYQSLFPPGFTSFSEDVAGWMASPESEYDGDGLENFYIPFWHTSFMNTACNVAARIKRWQKEDEEEQLWGNQAVFDLFWYRDAAIIMRLGEPVSHGGRTQLNKTDFEGQADE